MPRLQEQDRVLAALHPLRREAALPGAAGHEHRAKVIHHVDVRLLPFFLITLC